MTFRIEGPDRIRPARLNRKPGHPFIGLPASPHSPRDFIRENAFRRKAQRAWQTSQET